MTVGESGKRSTCRPSASQPGRQTARSSAVEPAKQTVSMRCSLLLVVWNWIRPESFCAISVPDSAEPRGLNRRLRVE